MSNSGAKRLNSTTGMTHLKITIFQVWVPTVFLFLMEIHATPEKLSLTSDIINSLDISVTAPCYRSLSIILCQYDFSFPLIFPQPIVLVQ
jgi:hypothetical protein